MARRRFLGWALLGLILLLAACGSPGDWRERLPFPPPVPTPTPVTLLPSPTPTEPPLPTATPTPSVEPSTPAPPKGITPTATPTPPSPLPPPPQIPYLAVVWERGGQADLWLLDPEGDQEPVRLTDDPAVESLPTWSPDGRFLAVVRDGRTLWIWDSRAEAGELFLAFRSPEPIRSVLWADPELLLLRTGSGTGARLRWVRRRGGQLGLSEPLAALADRQIWSVQGAAGTLVAVLSDPGEGIAEIYGAPLTPRALLGGREPLAEGYAPSLSPDGRALLFKAPPFDDDPGLYLLDLVTGERVLLTPPEMSWRRYIHLPVWSPDGTAAAWVASPYVYRDEEGRPHVGTEEPASDALGGAYGIYLWQRGDPSPVQLTDNGYDLDPIWSPDGRRLAFLSAGRTVFGVWDLWIVPAQGGIPRNLTEGRGNVWWAAWRPTP